MKRIINIVVIFLFLNANSNAAEYKSYDISKLSFDECKFQTVKFQLWMTALHNQVEIGKNLTKVLDEFQRIVEKAPNSNQPVGEQLNPQDLSRFGELRNQNIRLSEVSLIESKRMRDLDFIETAIEVTDKIYNFKKFPQNNRDKLVLMLLNETIKFNDKNLKETVFSKKECSMEVAIAKLEDQPINQSIKLSANNQAIEVLNYLNYLTKKYGTSHVDISKLNSEELTKFNTYQKSYIQPVTELKEEINVFEMIKAFEKASEIMYTARKQDAMNGSEDVNKSFSMKADNGAYDPLTTSAIKTLIYLDKVMPSEEEKALIENAKILDQANKDNSPLKAKYKKSSF